MSDVPPDVSTITPAAESPPDKPDSQTSAETKAFAKQKSPSPTDRMVEEHHEHLSTFREHITHHLEECRRCREELAQARVENIADRERGERLLAVEREKSERLGQECVKLRELSWAVGWMMLLGNGMVALGSIGLGIAGCWPKLPDETKYALGGSGAATAICGVVLTVLAFAAGRRARKPAN
jgi:hypothetical protein